MINKKSIILLVLFYYIYSLLVSGKIFYFIHPRMLIYIRICLVFLVVLIIVQIIELFMKNSERHECSFIILFPVILAVLINPQGLSGQVAANKGTILSQKVSLKDSAINPSDLFVNDSNFTSVTDDIIYSDPNKYKGKKLTITGFVYKSNDMGKNEFLIARLMMVCCAADAEVTGILSSFDKSYTLKSDEWITISGTIDTTTKKSGTGASEVIPIVIVKSIVPAQKPKNPYIYPE
ncbi:TIGR03943 family protein [Clostridium sp. 19966]|uniref:TIGR03943 family putative permease subunit n=1 Tax=Clostridium sp. 19966 TaxID=2768166 RepID=UPI0028DF3382|nr:TIGR03943 family protein [Clostridium sp. 19966]MDT8719466.1 TIGR03943 family protein [Clostridium sp. 19966]